MPKSILCVWCDCAFEYVGGGAGDVGAAPHKVKLGVGGVSGNSSPISSTEVSSSAGT